MQLTSNHHPDNIIVNALVRTQAENKLGDDEHPNNNRSNVFDILYHPISQISII